MDYRLAELKRRITEVPTSAGCYIFKARGVPIYVGKARSLQKRLRDYLGRGTAGDPKTAAMLERATSVELILTANETEALLLEMTLIRRHQPKYNVTIHGFPYIKVTAELFPRIFVTRETPDEKTGSYLGPYTDATAVRRVVDVANRLFKLRTCRYLLDGRRPRRPCLKYETGICQGPCGTAVTAEEYGAAVKAAARFIAGKRSGILGELNRRMREAADRWDFEEAAGWRDAIRGLKRAGAVQAAVVNSATDADAVACEVRGDRLYGVVIKVREGRIVDRVCVDTRPPAGDPYEEFLVGYYGAGGEVPQRVFWGRVGGRVATVSQTLAALRGGPVAVAYPRRGIGAELLKIALENLKHAITVSRTREERGGLVPKALQKALGVRRAPRVWEMVDISHITGSYAVGVIVAMREGVWDKSRYRRYRIRTAGGGDDYGAIAEVIRRRFCGREAGALPDVLVVDGGRGQLGAAMEALRETGVVGLTTAALAKDPDRLYLPGRRSPAPVGGELLSFLSRLRDEAHRFAVTYHRTLRRRSTTRSILDEVKGIGPVRKKALLAALGSAEGVATATLEELAAVKGMTLTSARAVYETLRRGGSDNNG